MRIMKRASEKTYGMQQVCDTAGRRGFPRSSGFFFLDVWGLNPDLREESELGWREGQGTNFWSTNTFCRMILSD